MTECYQKAIEVISRVKNNKESKVYTFFQSLLYGTYRQSGKGQQHLTHYNAYTQRAQDCLIYLHQHHIGILVCVDRFRTGIQSYFSIKNIQISQFSYQQELHKKLTQQTYLLLKDKKDLSIFLFKTIQDKNQFKHNMLQLKKFFSEIPDSYDPMILKAYIKADANQNGDISWFELKSLVQMMKVDFNIEIENFIKRILGREEVSNVEFYQFERLWKIFYCRNELIEVFEKYNREEFGTFEEYLSPKLDKEEFKKFLIEEQKQSQEQSNRVSRKMYQKDSSMSFYDFCIYIFGPHNNLLNDEYKEAIIKQEQIQKPLNQYYCYSSHNTYLTGDQFFSKSRAQRYLVDLENGIRCVEIDIHDGKDDKKEGPIVKHGYTATSSILFEDVIESIKRFVNQNPLHSPIILSLQNHCNTQNQKKVASILKKHLDGGNQKNILRINKKQNFPSLKQCKGKIIIKGSGDFKLFKQNQQKKESQIVGQYTQDQEEKERTQQFTVSIESNQELPLSQNYKKLKEEFSTIIKDVKENKSKFFPPKNQLKLQKKLPSLNKKTDQTNQSSSDNKTQYIVNKELLNLTSMLSKSLLQNQCCWQSTSFSENKVLQHYKNLDSINKIKRLSNHKWFRSYPNALRIWSSNYNPIPALQLGIQMVAINTQSKNDVNTHILKAFFTRGSKKITGYRLKPPHSKQLENHHILNNSKSNLPQYQNTKNQSQYLTKVALKFISGLRIYQNDQTDKSIPPVCVKAYFTGTKRDNQLNQKLLIPKEYTEVVYKQSFNPKFNRSERIQIKCFEPDLGFLVVEVPQCGRSVIPIDCIKPGWRVISLYDEELNEKQSKLLMHIMLTKTLLQYHPQQ